MADPQIVEILDSIINTVIEGGAQSSSQWEMGEENRYKRKRTGGVRQRKRNKAEGNNDHEEKAEDVGGEIGKEEVNWKQKYLEMEEENMLLKNELDIMKNRLKEVEDVNSKFIEYKFGLYFLCRDSSK
jgi:hypothetical protein